jgi:hypothetical protein
MARPLVAEADAIGAAAAGPPEVRGAPATAPA